MDKQSENYLGIYELVWPYLIAHNSILNFKYFQVGFFSNFQDMSASTAIPNFDPWYDGMGFQA